MASVNKVILVGNLGQDPDVKYLPSGDPVCNFSVATTDSWRDKEGNKQESTEWHKVSFFGKVAEICGQYLKKGSAVYVEGSIRTRKWQDKEGNDRYTTEIKGDRMQMLGGKKPESGDAPSGEAPKPRQQAAPKEGGGGFDDFNDDIPF